MTCMRNSYASYIAREMTPITNLIPHSATPLPPCNEGQIPIKFKTSLGDASKIE